MNKSALILCLPALGGLALAAVVRSRAADAASMNIPGSICRPKNSNHTADLVPSDGTIMENASSTTQRSVNCPVPVDTQVGSVLEYRFLGVDRSSTQSVLCRGVSVNSDNTTAWAGVDVSSSSDPAFMGAFNVPSGSGPASVASQRHFAACTLPPRNVSGARSAIHGIRLF